MSSELFAYTKDEWDLSLLYCAELFNTIPSITSNIDKKYKTDALHYYEAAQQSPYLEHRNVRSYLPDKARIITECLGILYAAEDNAADLKFALKQFEAAWPKEYNCFRKINNQTMQYVCDDMSIGVAQAVAPFLIRYLLPSASGDPKRLDWFIDYTRRILDENLQHINELNRSADNYRKTLRLTEQDNLLVEMAENPNALWEYQSGYSNPRKSTTSFDAAISKNPALWKKFSENYKANYNYLRRCVGWQTFGQIDEAFASRGIELGRFFENNAFSKELANQAVSFSGILSDRATRKWEDPELHSITPPAELNEIVFSPRQFVMFYYLLALLDEYVDLRKKYETLEPEAVALADNLKQNQVDRLRNEVVNLTQQLESEKAKNETLRAKVAAYQKGDLNSVKKVEARFEAQISLLEAQLASYEQTKPELEQLRNFFFQQNTEPHFLEADDEPVDFVAELAQYKIITVGGHEQLRKNLKKEYPSIITLDGTLKSQDFHLVEGADHVFILTQHMSHAVYFNLMKQLERFHVPFSYLDKTNVSFLADEMMKQLHSWMS